MTRVDTIRAGLVRKLRSPPFHPFALNMENGDRIIVEHPENVAFDPIEGGRDWVYVVTGDDGFSGALSEIMSITVIDRHTSSS